MAKATIIVPIYNVEKYLRKCFDSLLNQTSDDFIVYAVNDGSPDHCDEIIKEYCRNYPEKIRGIRKENGGYGSVLQVAIKETRTPYFLVCDPDDTLEPEAMETLLSLAAVGDADITIGAKMVTYEDSTIKEYDCSYNRDFVQLKSNTVYNADQENFNDLFFVNPSPHAKLYRTSLARDIVFPEHVGYTDNMLFYLSLLNAQKVIYTEKPLANYLINRKGNSMTDVSFSAMNGQIRVFKSILNEAERASHHPDIFYYRMFESFKFMLYQMNRLRCTEDQYDETLDYLQTYLKKLTPYEAKIRPFYDRFSKTKIIEKLRDYALMNERHSEHAYAGLKKRMMEEFRKKHPQEEPSQNNS